MESFDNSADNPIIKLLDTIRRYPSVVVVYGQEVSPLNGTQSKQAYDLLKNDLVKTVKGLEDLIAKIENFRSLESLTVDQEQQLEDLIDQRNKKFNEVKQDLSQTKNFASILGQFTKFPPELHHFTWAAICLALHQQPIDQKGNLLLSLNINFDNVVENAFISLSMEDTGLPTKITLIPWFNEDYADSIRYNSEQSIKDGRPAIVKLFGDTEVTDPMFEDRVPLKLNQLIRTWLESLFKQPIIFLGYDFSHEAIAEHLIEYKRSAPVYIVGIGQTPPLDIKPKHLVEYIPLSFSEFTKTIKHELVKKHRPFADDLNKFLSRVDPKVRYKSFEDIQEMAVLSSELTRQRINTKLPHHDQSQVLTPIPRTDTQPKIDKFLKADQPLLAIIGESGTGKSTLLYNIANQDRGNYTTIFMDVHGFLRDEKLNEWMARIFACAPNETVINEVLEHFNKILKEEEKYLLIIIDSLNESKGAPPIKIRDEIESLGVRLQRISTRIKLIYSCREIYWNEVMSPVNPVNRSSHFYSKEFILYQFSEKEAKLAFSTYQDFFGFQGNYDRLNKELQEKVRDPLMLRMMAEAYQGQVLPTFAPAVVIFRKYEEMLHEKLSDMRMITLKHMVQLKAKELFKEKRLDDQFEVMQQFADHTFVNLHSAINDKDKKGEELDFFIKLSDEGVLSAVDDFGSFYRFAYDRFFEYLMGCQIGNMIVTESKDEFIDSVQKLALEVTQHHFSFSQALKSELVRANLDQDPFQAILFEKSVFRRMLQIRDPHFQIIFKDFLRELIFDSNKEVIAAIKQAVDDETEATELILEVAGDSAKAYPTLIDGVNSGNLAVVRRSIHFSSQLLDHSFLNPQGDTFSTKIWQKFNAAGEEEFGQFLMGMVYLMGVSFQLALNMRVEWAQVLTQMVSRIGLKKFEKGRTMLKKEILLVMNREIPLMNQTEFQPERMNYFWEVMTEKEIEKSLEMIDMVKERPKALTHGQTELLRFFGSEIKFWEELDHLDTAENYNYVLEKRIAEFILLDYSKDNFKEFCEILDQWVQTGYWLTIDLCLIIMQKSLEHVHEGNKIWLDKGYQLLKEWTSIFREKCHKYFYMAVQSPDPLMVNFVPYSQLATIECSYLLEYDQPISSFIEPISSGDIRDTINVILSMRGLWKRFPGQVLSTLELLLKRNEEQLMAYMNVVIKEMYLVYPKLVEEFFRKNKVSKERRIAIKIENTTTDPTGISYHWDGIFFNYLTETPHGRYEFYNAYRELLSSASLEDFVEGKLDKALATL